MAELEYVLGTHDREIERLGLQHAVWRPRVMSAWRRAGIKPGHTALDLGCGPGYGSLDLASIVGSGGRVVAVDQSRRFLDHLERRAKAEEHTNVEAVQGDLSQDDLPPVAADLVWARWIFAFVRDPRALLGRAVSALRPGGALVVHEYYDYSSWRMLPPCPELEEFVAHVMDAWRATGGEPNVGRWLPSWMAELPVEITTLRPHVTVAQPGEPMWQWPIAFMRSGLDRLVSLERLTSGRAASLLTGIETAEQQPAARMCTPSVLEIVARRR